MNIIQTWKTNQIPDIYLEFVESVKKYGKKFKYLFFNDQDIINFIKNEFPEYLHTFNNLNYKIQQIDFFRYLAIYHFGGIYLDLDVKLTHYLEELINEPHICKFPIEQENIEDKLIRKQGFSSLIGQYAFYAPAKHPFLKKIIDNIVKPRIPFSHIMSASERHSDKASDVLVYYTTGPILVTQSFLDMDYKINIELLRTQPFTSNKFGKYGVHNCHGTWR
tara:strand:- start:349 stop:1008 length:660 start_codon:yes stop_codon:yes gene_type:complete